MQVLVIPDVHLKPELFDRADELINSGVASRTVCLMDLPDDWQKELDIELYERTFDRAIKYQQDHPDTLWCYGNHDVSYMWGYTETRFSPYAISTVNNKLNELKRVLPSLDQISYIHRIDNVLFLHGGLCERFVKTYVDGSKWNDIDKVIRAINKLDSETMWKEISPIWYRPQYSDDRMFEEFTLTQVVGHTPVPSITKRNNVISCDVFSTDRDGSPIGTCEFPVIDTVTGEFTSVK